MHVALHGESGVILRFAPKKTKAVFLLEKDGFCWLRGPATTETDIRSQF